MEQTPDIDAEADVLGCLLWGEKNDVADDVFDLLTSPDHFTNSKHRLIFTAMLHLWRVEYEQISDITVRLRLLETGNLEAVGGTAFLLHLKEQAEYSVSCLRSAQVVRDNYVRLRTTEELRTLVRAAMDVSKPIGEALSDTQAALTALSDKATPGDVLSAADLSGQFGKELNSYQIGEAQKSLISTGLDNLDELLLGFRPGQFIIIGGRTGQGKTTLAMQIAEHNSRNGLPVIVFSLEMVPLELYFRLVSTVAEVDSRLMHKKCAITDTDFIKIAKAEARLKPQPLYFDAGIDKTNASIRSKLRQQIRKRGIRLAVIDYIGLVTPAKRSENKVQEVSYISRELKRMAVDLEIPVIGLSQLSRQGQQREDKAPKLSDLRDSGALEQDADIVMFIDAVPGTDDQARIYVQKNRAGRCGHVDLLYRKEYTKLYALATNYGEELYG